MPPISALKHVLDNGSFLVAERQHRSGEQVGEDSPFGDRYHVDLRAAARLRVLRGRGAGHADAAAGRVKTAFDGQGRLVGLQARLGAAD